ncbi:MAG: cytochrome c maturation protein CcmE [Planctomycetota bacterium]|nr:cytochrome c maturation protein CcmE [Planctomycetota bacterium]
MPAFKVKHLIAVAAIVGSLSYLGVAGYRAGIVYYLSVDQLLSQPQVAGARVRVHGIVVDAQPLPVDPETGSPASGRRLVLRGTTGSLTIDYTGNVPDGLAIGREIVAEGVMDQPSCLKADVLMTKCATKYQAAAAADTGAK